MAVLFFDLDGTLLNEQKVAPQSATDAIRQAKKNGHTASGEQRYMCKRCDYQFTDRTAKEILLKCTKAHPYMRWRKKENLAHEKQK